jgi:hypothetical protein
MNPNLNPDERYSGVVLDADGNILHHLVLLPDKPPKRLPWPAAMEWAKGAGGSLPTRQEAALLFANCKPHLEQRWHWTSEADGPSYAWHCYFDHGIQLSIHQSYEGGAVAVRRIKPEDWK